jgi:hypothetical protein
MHPAIKEQTMEKVIKSHVSHPSFRWSVYSILLMAIGSLGAYFLLTRHYAHVLDALPFLLLLGCTLMHVFMQHTTVTEDMLTTEAVRSRPKRHHEVPWRILDRSLFR